MRVYSNAWVDKETGDLNGFELAIKNTASHEIEALLYVFEGAPDQGIRLMGRISGENVEIKGDWIEHQIEYPSKREIIQTHFVKIDGTLKPAAFRGKISIKDLGIDSHVRLKRVKHIWVCKP